MNLPVLFGEGRDDLPAVSSQVAEAVRLQATAELEVFSYQTGRWVLSEFDRIDSLAVTEASEAAFVAEAEFLKRGLAIAGQSQTLIASLARHAERVGVINDRRITRRFGG